ncbi:MAG: cupin domain-containing protein [Chloroflexi bacterium]|nr:cupin domain-containing protein [Chloroflexota bacterium]
MPPIRQKKPKSPSRKTRSARSAFEINVGQRLRALRTEHDLSVRALAEKSGLAMNTLSLIENSKTSPSVSTLQQIAFALAVPITAFFQSSIPKNSVVHHKAGTSPHIAFEHGTLEDLGTGLSHQAVEPFIVTLGPQAGSGSRMIVHTGYEFVYCLEGRIAYTIDERTYLLEPGDSLLFESYLPHRWHNVDSKAARAILVLYPSDENDQPTERHFAPKK